MAVVTSQEKPTLTSETKVVIEKYCGTDLSEADLLEVRNSLFHLGKAIYLYSLQKIGGEHE